MRADKHGYVYIITNSNHTVLYIGVTSNIEKRLYEHKKGIVKTSFSSRYNLNKLVHLERYSSIEDAITREKVLKNWKRKWKEWLISKNNRYWLDLAEHLKE